MTATGCESASDGDKQVPHSLGIPHNFVTAQLALPKDTVDKDNGRLGNRVPLRPRPNENLHLKDVALGGALMHEIADDVLLV